MYSANKIETFRMACRCRHGPSRVLVILCLLITTLLCQAGLTNTADAATYYLDAVDGNDVTGDGSSEAPWKTVGHAIDTVSSGDTVIMAGGMYDAVIKLNWGGFSDWVTFKAANGQTPVIPYIELTSGGTVNLYLKFDGITIQPGKKTGDPKFYIYPQNGSYLQLLNCTFIGDGYSEGDWTDHGVFLNGTTNNITIDGCLFTGDGPDPARGRRYAIHYGGNNITITNCEIEYHGTGIAMGGNNILIQNNHIHHMQDDGIVVWTSNGMQVLGNHIHHLSLPDGWSTHNDGIQVHFNDNVDNLTIANNIIHDSTHTGFFLNPKGTADTWLIENNLVYDTLNANLISSVDGITFRNNVITGTLLSRANYGYDTIWTSLHNNIVSGFDFYGTQDANDVIVLNEDYNIYYSSGWRWKPSGADTVRLAHSTAFQALFADYDANDFHLVAASQTIDFCPLDKAPTTDLEGNSRIDIQGVGNDDTDYADAGCYEYVDPNSQIYSITASAGTEGQISPGGTIQVNSGGTQTYTMTPNAGYTIVDVLVNGNSVGNGSSYTFTNVTANHTIAAIFTYTITASANGGGTISPSGTTQVSSGGSQTYTITQDTGHDISDVLVDGSSVGAVTSYSFTNVTANHTIAAIFTYTITASANGGGTIGPSGTTQVVPGGSQAYSITVNSGYHISDVLVDGSSVGAVTSYSFTNVTANHTIAATFAINTYTITASAGSGGTISPSGTTQVNWSGTQSYTITLNAGYHISDVLVDGSSVGVVTSYSFTNVTANHTIAATFAEQDVTKPIVTNLSPQTDSIQAPLNTLVILDITDSGDGVDANSVTVKVNNNIVYTGNTNHYPSADGDCRRLGTKADYRFIYHQWKQNFDFDQPINVTVNATDLAGNIMDEYSYSFKSEMRSFGENKILHSGSNNENWGPLTTVADSSGNIWVAWPQGVVGSRDIYVGKLVAGTDSFVSSGVVPVTIDIPDQGNPVIAVDSSDKLYLAWQDNRRGNWDIYVSTSNDWSAEIRVTDSNDNQTKPAIVIDSNSPNNNAYIVWEDDRHGNQDIYVAKSSDGFATKMVSQITSDDSNQVEPAIAADWENTIYVVWTDTRNGGKNDIYGAASNSGLWTNIPIVTEEESQSNPAIATEAQGSVLHFVWLDDTPGDDDIYYASTSDGLPSSSLTGRSIIDDPCEKDQLSPVIITTGYTGNDLRVFACWRDERWADADLFFDELSSGDVNNVFVGDDDTSTDQSEPAIGIDGYGQPYIVWINERTDICYAGSTFIEPVVLASSTASVSSKTTVGTVPGSITNIDDVSTEVPQGAYLCDVKVTISRIRNPHKPPSNNRTFLYEFGPSGTTFSESEPVTITIPYNATTLVSSPSAYWYNPLTGLYSQEGITDVEVIQISSGLYALRFKTTHFSIFGGGGPFGGGGGGGGCSMSPNSQGSIVEFLLPYIGLTVVMTILKLRDRRKNKMHDIAKSEC